MNKKTVFVVGALVAAGFYFRDDVTRVAHQVVDVKAIEYGAVSGPGMIHSADNLGQSLDGSFRSFGGALK